MKSVCVYLAFILCHYLNVMSITVDLDCGFKAVSDRIDDENTADNLVSACNGRNVFEKNRSKNLN